MKDKETERRVKRCTGCRWLEPKEFVQHWRLWEFLTCRVCRKQVRTLAVCPVTWDRKPE